MAEVTSRVSVYVSKVNRGHKLLQTSTYEEVLSKLLGQRPEAYSRSQRYLIAGGWLHPFVDAVDTAFNYHYPLVLSPDHIWLCIVQGLALHLNINAEKFRDCFVRHQGNKKLEIRRDDFIEGSPENPWDEAIDELSEQVKASIGDQYDLIVCNFSTTGKIERVVSEIVLMDTVKKYFDYRIRSLCGIPKITLEGTVEDWQSIRQRIEQFAEFDLQWWLDGLIPVIDQFVTTVSLSNEYGESEARNQAFWRSFYKRSDYSGGPYITGWISVFFPYLEHGNSLIQNPYIQPWAEVIAAQSYLEQMNDQWLGPSTDTFPSSLSKVPFQWEFLDRVLDMNFVGGFIGLSQDQKTSEVRPEIGWAITKTV